MPRWALEAKNGQLYTTEKHEADWYKMRSITQQNDLDGSILVIPSSKGHETNGLCRILDDSRVGGHRFHSWFALPFPSLYGNLSGLTMITARENEFHENHP